MTLSELKESMNECISLRDEIREIENDFKEVDENMEAIKRTIKEIDEREENPLEREMKREIRKTMEKSFYPLPMPNMPEENIIILEDEKSTILKSMSDMLKLMQIVSDKIQNDIISQIEEIQSDYESDPQE